MIPFRLTVNPLWTGGILNRMVEDSIPVSGCKSRIREVGSSVPPLSLPISGSSGVLLELYRFGTLPANCFSSSSISL